MTRNRLTWKTGNADVLVAADNSNYGRFRVKLLELYPDLRKDAEQYGFEGELGNSNFVFHHLDTSSTHLIPSCISSKNLDDSLAGDRNQKCKTLNQVLRYKLYLNELNHSRAKWLKTEFAGLSDNELSNLNTLLGKLNREVTSLILIPKSFHDYLHSFPDALKKSLPKTRRECYQAYRVYIENRLKSKEEIRKYEKKLETFRGCLEAINEIANTLKGEYKDVVYAELKKCGNKLLNLIKNTRRNNER